MNVESEKGIMRISGFMKTYNEELYKHCKRTAEYAIQTAEEIGYEQKEMLYNAALVHDIGKMVLAYQLYDKPGGLSNEERNAVNLHSFLGYSISKNTGICEAVCQLILMHHGTDKERYGVELTQDKEIIYGAKILRAADAYDALTSRRIYMPEIAHRQAVEILLAENETDNEIVHTLDMIMLKKHDMHCAQ
jgi:CRISPR-associated endonuclease Cas3-HD